MNKRQGYYNHLVEKEDALLSFNKNGEEVTGKYSRRVRGHFSINFWAHLHNHLKTDDLSVVFSYFSAGFNYQKVKELIYFSAVAFSDEMTLKGYPMESDVKSIEDAGVLIELSDSLVDSVNDAFSSCQIVTELTKKLEEKADEDLSKKKS